MPASIPVRLAPALQFLGRISYDLTVYNVHSRVFSSMDYSRRKVLDTCIIPDLAALDIPLPTFATVCERRKGEVLCHWEVNLLDNVSRSSSMSLAVNVRSQQDTTIRGLTATVEGLSAKIHVLIREIQELAPEGYDLDRLGRLMRTSFTP